MSDYGASELAAWMQHGIALCADMLWAADEMIRRERLNQVEKRRLQKELVIRQRVLARFQGADVELSPVELAWRTYLLKHAGLEIQWSRGEISQEQFLTACYALLAARKEAIRAWQKII